MRFEQSLVQEKTKKVLLEKSPIRSLNCPIVISIDENLMTPVIIGFFQEA
jgi:hypothetical protein